MSILHLCNKTFELHNNYLMNFIIVNCSEKIISISCIYVKSDSFFSILIIHYYSPSYLLLLSMYFYYVFSCKTNIFNPDHKVHYSTSLFNLKYRLLDQNISSNRTAIDKDCI